MKKNYTTEEKYTDMSVRPSYAGKPHLVLSPIRGGVIVTFSSKRIFFFFFLTSVGKENSLNWVFEMLYYRESQKMYYANDYLPY